MTLDILKVFDQRLRANPASLTVYEHEVSKFADALRGMAQDYLSTLDLESNIRSGLFRYRGYPVRVDGELSRPESHTPD